MPTAAVSLSPCVGGRFVGKAENIRPSPRACCATFPLDTQRRPEGPHVYIRTFTYICTSTGMYSTSTSIHRFGPTISGYPQDAPLLTFRVGIGISTPRRTGILPGPVANLLAPFSTEDLASHQKTCPPLPSTDSHLPAKRAVTKSHGIAEEVQALRGRGCRDPS